MTEMASLHFDLILVDIPTVETTESYSMMLCIHSGRRLSLINEHGSMVVAKTFASIFAGLLHQKTKVFEAMMTLWAAISYPNIRHLA